MMNPNSPCSTCAFNPKGSAGAADEVKNHFTGLISAHAATPFWCHHSKSGPEYDWKNDPLGPMSLPPGERRVCAGWKALTAKLHGRGGKYDFALERPEDRTALRQYQRGLGIEALARLKDLSTCKPEEKAQANKDLRSVTLALFGRSE